MKIIFNGILNCIMVFIFITFVLYFCYLTASFISFNLESVFLSYLVLRIIIVISVIIGILLTIADNGKLFFEK